MQRRSYTNAQYFQEIDYIPLRSGKFWTLFGYSLDLEITVHSYSGDVTPVTWRDDSVANFQVQ